MTQLKQPEGKDPLTGPGSWRWDFRKEATKILEVYRGYGNDIFVPEVVHSFERLVEKYAEQVNSEQRKE